MGLGSQYIENLSPYGQESGAIFIVRPHAPKNSTSGSIWAKTTLCYFDVLSRHPMTARKALAVIL